MACTVHPVVEDRHHARAARLVADFARRERVEGPHARWTARLAEHLRSGGDEGAGLEILQELRRQDDEAERARIAWLQARWSSVSRKTSVAAPLASSGRAAATLGHVGRARAGGHVGAHCPIGATRGQTEAIGTSRLGDCCSSDRQECENTGQFGEGRA